MNTKINLGCGRKYMEGWLNCDANRRVKADVYFDANQFPYPLESDCAELILMDNVLEHLQDIPRIMDELHRVLQPGGVLRILVPYAKTEGALWDPTHLHFFTEKSMDYFCAGTEKSEISYSSHHYEMVAAELVSFNKTLGNKVRNALPLRKVLRYFFWNMYDGLRFELRKPLTPARQP